VTLRNLTITFSNGILNPGIDFKDGAALFVENCVIDGFNMGLGIMFEPSSNAKLYVTDSIIKNNGNTGTEAGIYVKPGSGAQANITVERSRIENNFFGIIADGSGGGTIGGVVRDSVVSGSANNGITTSSTGTSTTLVVQNASVAANAFGLAAAGPNAGILVTRSAINYNGTGVFGAIYSYGDNSLNGNGADGAFAAKLGLQ
jgi:hypothetical protein